MITIIPEKQRRKSPMSALEIRKLREGVLRKIAKNPRSCSDLAKDFDLHKKTMMNYLREMNELGQIHATKVVIGSRTSFIWQLGQGEAVGRVYKKKPIPGSMQKQLRVTSWPPVDIPKQGVFAALGL